MTEDPESNGTDPEPDEGDATDNGEGPGEIVPEGPEDSFSREYVEGLRSEAAALRVRAKRADELHAALLDAVIREGTAGLLEDSDDVWRDREVDDFLDDAGLPSVERVREIATELAKSKPHLAARRRPTGDISQGARAEPEPVNLAAMLRRSAG